MENNSLIEKQSIFTERQWIFIQNFYSLTLRELEVSQLVCKGLNNLAIGKVLKIKLGTVKTYLRNVYRRVRVNNKISLFLKFMEDLEERDI